MSRVLERTVDYLANRLDRRGFLGKTAVVGSAVVTAPLEFGLKPKSAYAAVCRCNGSSCGCGSLCCDGYTEFCCTLKGANTCPAGTITAGWWKVDGSNFCGGAARYYLDCNAQCGGCSCGSNGVCAGSCSGTGCGCAKGSCNNRKAGCTRFRYGQCNQHVRCVGPIVCRVVTCTPPWLFDPACGTSSRTDNATRYHDRPCLNEPFGNIDSAIDTRSGRVRVRGWAVSNLDYGQTNVRIFIDGNQVAEVLANKPRPDVKAAYPAFGANHGYELDVPAATGKRMVCAYAVDRRNGRTTFLGFREVNVTGPRGSIDRVIDLGGGKIRIEGWAVDHADPGGRATIVYRVDDREVGRYITAVPRPDVVRAIPGANPQSGFSVDFAVAPGQRRVCVNVLSKQGHSVQIGCRLVTAAAKPFGSIDSVTDEGGGQVRVRGWVIDPRRGAGPVPIRIRAGSSTTTTTTTGTIVADGSRPDVGRAHPSYGPNHGFDEIVAAPSGPISVCVDTLHDAGSTTALACRDTTVAG